MGDDPTYHLRGATLQIRILRPLRGRNSSSQLMCPTYPKPSLPALQHEDSTLHGAPTVEDTHTCEIK